MNKINLDKIDLTQLPPEHEPERQYYFMAKCREYVRAESKRLGRPLFYGAYTFGCQMNAKDSEKLAGILEKIGYQPTDSQQQADFIIYNTCTVRENANLKVYGKLGYLQTLKKKNPNMRIALCGCMMQEAHVIEKIKKSYRFVDIIFGTHNIYKLAELIDAHFCSERMVIDIWKDTNEIVENLPTERKYSFKSGVNIMFGCNNFCSYCIVPYVRGRERSRRPEDILQEIRSLVSDGVVEVMLLGQNVNSYGKTFEQPIRFAELLKQVEQIDGLKRIRFMTSHPKDLSDELIDVMKHSKKICRQLHLPVQSGSTEILKRMNRHYTKEQYLALIEKMRAAIPDISFTTDIMVGFPGETEQDFEETLDLVKKIRYDSAYTFIYSKRSGTPASVLEEQIPDDVIKKRFDRLLLEIQQISAELTQKAVGKTEEVLVEEINHQKSTMLTGRLNNNLLVHFPGSEEQIGTLVNVKLLESKGFYYLGEQVNT